MIDGHQRLLISGDYPYYRDKVEHWLDKITKIKSLGINTISFYIPWRHHSVDDDTVRRFTFDGSYRANQDLITFIKYCKTVGLYCLVKPGPFVHGEIQLGGLPDYISSSIDPRYTALLNQLQQPLTSQDMILPSPCSSLFIAEALKWMETVYKEIIIPHIYPKGPIIAVQIGNEGIYSDNNMPLTAFDYSAEALDAYKKYMEEMPLKINSQRSIQLVSELSWASWSGIYLANFLNEMASSLPTRIIKFANIAPPAHPDHFKGDANTEYDTWLARVRPDLWHSINYGFTSWVGNAITNERAFLTQLFAAKCYRGPNLEENWGHLWHDQTYRHAVVCIYHNALALAAGATGINIYNACSTAHWDTHLDIDINYRRRAFPNPALYDPPYCPAAPIDTHGALTEKAETLKIFLSFLQAEQDQLLLCKPITHVTIAYQLAHAQAVAMNSQIDYSELLSLTSGITDLQSILLNEAIGFNVIEFQRIDFSNLQLHPTIIFIGCPWMTETVQASLCDYVKKGGRLLLFWDVPTRDENFEPCSILSDCLFKHEYLGDKIPTSIKRLDRRVRSRKLKISPQARTLLSSNEGMTLAYEVSYGLGKAYYFDFAPDICLSFFIRQIIGGYEAVILPESPGKKMPFIANFENKDLALSYIFILNREDKEIKINTLIQDKILQINLNSKTVGILKIKNGQFAGGYVKVRNEMLKNNSSVTLVYHTNCIINDVKNDIAIVQDENGQLKLHATIQDPHIELIIL